MSVKVRFALVFCVLLLVLVDCCQASGGQDGDEGFLEYLYTTKTDGLYLHIMGYLSCTVASPKRVHMMREVK